MTEESGDAERRAHPLELRISRIITAIATAWFALAATWELFGPVLAGHYASNASMGIIAENMVRLHMWAPVWTYSDKPPTPDLYYCHHPWGIFWVTKLFYWLFGRHDFVCRLPAVLLSIATPPLLAATCRSMFRPYAGAAAAVGFVVLPITLSFASFNALEVPVMAHSALMLWGYVKLRERPQRRYLVASLVGLAFALSSDWPAFVLVGALLGVDLVAIVFAQPVNRPLERLRVTWWLLAATLSVVTLGAYVREFRDDGKLDDLLGSYSMRSAGNELPLAKVLESRRYWIALSFTPIAILLGKAYAVIAALRLAVRRTTLEALPLCVLLMATVQYVVFRQGADIHVFWPHYFGEYFALACGGLVATLASGAEYALRRLRPRLAPYAAVGSLAFVCVTLAFVLRDGVVALGYAHATGGRFNEKGLRIESDADKIAASQWLTKDTRDVALHATFNPNWADMWALGARVVPVNAPPPSPGTKRVTLADARFLPDTGKTNLLQSFAVTAVGPFWALRASPALPEAFTFTEREPSALHWYFSSGTEPVRGVVPDPWGTWELRAHYGFDPGELPTATEPIDAPAGALEFHRIRHNAYLAQGDTAAADTELAAMDAACHPVDGPFDDGTRIRCVLYHEGASPLLVIVFEPSGPLAAGVELRVTSRVVERMPISTTMADPVVRDVSFPFTLAPSFFRRGFVYSHFVRVRHRPGTEVFEASFAGAGAPTCRDPVEVLRWP